MKGYVTLHEDGERDGRVGREQVSSVVPGAAAENILLYILFTKIYILVNIKGINVCCFKVLSVWPFLLLTAAALN